MNRNRDKMKIATGHRVTKDQLIHEFDTVRFLAEDGRCMFQVSIGDDGKSIEVMGVDSYKADDQLFDSTLAVEPRAANLIHIRTKLYR